MLLVPDLDAVLTAFGEHNVGLQVLTAPHLIALAGQSAAVAITSPVTYLERRQYGCFELVESENTEDLEVELRCDPHDDGTLTVQIVDLEISHIMAREVVEGLPFDAGRPTLQTIGTSAKFRITSDTGAMLQLPREKNTSPHIAVFVWAKLIETEER